MLWSDEVLLIKAGFPSFFLLASRIKWLHSFFLDFLALLFLVLDSLFFFSFFSRFSSFAPTSWTFCLLSVPSSSINSSLSLTCSSFLAPFTFSWWGGLNSRISSLLSYFFILATWETFWINTYDSFSFEDIFSYSRVSEAIVWATFFSLVFSLGGDFVSGWGSSSLLRGLGGTKSCF